MNTVTVFAIAWVWVVAGIVLNSFLKDALLESIPRRITRKYANRIPLLVVVFAPLIIAGLPFATLLYTAVLSIKEWKENRDV